MATTGKRREDTREEAGQSCLVMPSVLSFGMLLNGVPAVGDGRQHYSLPACPVAHLSAVDVLDGLLAEEEVDVLLVRKSPHKIRRWRQREEERKGKVTIARGDKGDKVASLGGQICPHLHRCRKLGSVLV